MIKARTLYGAPVDEGAFTDIKEALVQLDMAGATKADAYIKEDKIMLVEKTQQRDNEKFLDMMTEFIEHNKNLNHIEGVSSVDELLMLISRIKSNYLPMMEKVNKYAEEVLNRG